MLAYQSFPVISTMESPMRAMVAACAVLCLSLGAARADVSGRARALDGGTLEIDGRAIALYGVQAPPASEVCREWVPQGQREYRCGALARAFLQSIVAADPAYCVFEVAQRGAPESATCFVAGRDLGLALVQAGWAVAAQARSGRYVDAEQAARLARSGLWAGSSANPASWGDRAGAR